MKLNFIQNLSDQVVRENHELKTQLHVARQQLKDYEWEMLDLIATIIPQRPLALTPSETLQEFIQHVRQQLLELKEVKQHAQLLRKKLQELQQEEIEHINAIAQLKLELHTQQQGLEQSLAEALEKVREAQEEIEWMRTYNSKLTEEMSQIKIEKLRLEEGKRRAIQEMRHVQKNQLINFREKNEEEHMKVEKELRREIEMRDNTIREMSRSLAILTDAKTIPNSAAVLEDIFKSFQNYEKLTVTNAELKQENQELREEVKALFNRIIIVETNLEQQKAVENNVRSELERTMLQKLDIQRQLLVKITEIAKCEKDKEAMEQYYDQKWNSEYKRVKAKLENTYAAKIDDVEKEGKAKIIALQQTLQDVCQEKEEYRSQVQQLQFTLRKQELQRKNLESTIHIFKHKVKDLAVVNRETAFMATEEILTIKKVFQEQKTELLATIADRQNTIAQKIQKLKWLQAQNLDEKAALCQRHKEQLKKQEESFNLQRQVLIKQYADQINSLQKEILKHIESAKQIRSIVEQEFNVKLEAERALLFKAIAQKDEQIACQNNRWIDKYCELESFLGVNRRKLEEEIDSTKKEVTALLDSDYRLHQERHLLQENIKCLEAQIKAFQAEVHEKRTVISEKESDLATVKRELTASRKEAEVLLANRKLWKGELVDLQREFAKELDCLRKISDKQISHYKDKIHELEDLNRKKSLTRRELEKLQNSNTERQTLQSEIQLKEAENIILHQVKDYYQARLRESESQMGRSEFRTTQAILTRRPNKKRLCNNEVASHRVLETKEQVFERRRYAITSAKKHYNLSLSKGRLEENEHRPHKSSSSLCET